MPSTMLQDPPSFLLPGQLVEEELAKQVRVQTEEDSLQTGTLVEPGESTQETNEATFEDMFGSEGFEDQFDFQTTRDDRYTSTTGSVWGGALETTIGQARIALTISHSHTFTSSSLTPSLQGCPD